MAYRFVVNQQTCINCGICMDLCPVRCLDMSRPSGEGEIGQDWARQKSYPWSVGRPPLDDAGPRPGCPVRGMSGLCPRMSH